MNSKLPIYEIKIDLNDPNTGVEFNSLVHDPAHEISFETFSKRKRWTFSDEQKIVTGVAISADTPIYRNNSGEEYYVVFTKDAIKDIIHDYARNGRFNNVNIEHNSKDIADGVYMIHSYQIDNDRGFTAPERFKNEKDGTWIVSYQFEDEELYKRAKDGEMTGFSVEGTFIMEDAKFNAEQKVLTQLDELITLLKK